MTLFVVLSCYLLKKSKYEAKIAGDIFTDKRFFTDKPLIKIENVAFCYSIVLFAEKEKI